MRNVALITLIIVCCSFQQKQLNKSLLTLQGKWKTIRNKETIVEEWQKVNNHLLKGKSYKIKANKDTVNLEIMNLKTVQGKTLFVPVSATENNGKPVIFTLAKWANNKFEFVNLKHDFPKRIVYHIINKDSIHAWVDDSFDKTDNRLDFYYSRVK